MIEFLEISDEDPALFHSPMVRAIEKTFAYIADQGSIGLTPLKVSMAETKCASWRGKIVPVWFREKGCMSPCELWRRAHRGVRRVA
jgi:hypothetical protein